jgi:hypothetical protein
MTPASIEAAGALERAVSDNCLIREASTRHADVDEAPVGMPDRVDASSMAWDIRVRPVSKRITVPCSEGCGHILG